MTAVMDQPAEVVAGGVGVADIIAVAALYASPWPTAGLVDAPIQTAERASAQGQGVLVGLGDCQARWLLTQLAAPRPAMWVDTDRLAACTQLAARLRAVQVADVASRGPVLDHAIEGA